MILAASGIFNAIRTTSFASDWVRVMLFALHCLHCVLFSAKVAAASAASNAASLLLPGSLYFFL